MDILGVLLFGVWVYAIIDALITEKSTVRNLPKWAWIAIIVVLFVLGAVLWFVLGRPSRPFSARTDTGGSVPSRPATARRVRPPSRADRAEEEADIRARIAERDRLLAQWAEEDRRKLPPPDDAAR